ncbi:hypothetical protein NMY22_g7818 [Coprinellus aureogranulatus]|nr:hypothetical protein NMY22_g7818 [Coprinellus aureogranulatus]
MSHPPAKRSYASVVAGVKASALIEPQVPGPQSIRDASPLSGVGPVTPATVPQIGEPSENLSPALQLEATQPATPMSCTSQSGGNLPTPSKAPTGSEADAPSQSVQNYAIQDGPGGARPLTPESILDSGAIFDPEDSSYRGRVVNNLVGVPDAESIIKTRAARAAEVHKSQFPNSTPPTQPRLKDDGSMAVSLPTQPMSATPKVHRGRGRQSSSRGKAVARRPATKGNVSANQARPPTADVVNDPEDMPVVPSSKRRRQVPAVTPGPHAGSEGELYDSADSVSRKRLRTDRPQLSQVLVADREDGEVSDIEMVDNPASSGIENHGLTDEDDEGYSSDVDSLKDFIVDDDAPIVMQPGSVSTTKGDDTQPTSDHVMKGERVDAAMDADAPANAPLVATKADILRAGSEPNLVAKSDFRGNLAASVPPVVAMQEPLTQTKPEMSKSTTRPSQKSLLLGYLADGKKAAKPTRRQPRSFKSVIATTRNPMSAVSASSSRSERLLDDLYHYKIDKEPDICEVTSQELQDPLLREFYSECPKLRRGSFQSWSEATGPGMVFFSRWGENCPDMDFDTCISAVQFVQHGRYINPSRLSPTKACVKYIPAARPKYHLCTADRETAICLSPVMCVASHVIEPPERGLRQKWLAAIFHSQEWERFVSFMCMVFGHDTLQAQLAKDAIQFTTRAQFSAKDPSKATSMFSNIRSPSIVSRTNVAPVKVTDTSMTLDFDAPIPVYDCRNIALDFSEGVGDLSSYPKWAGEIPYGSFVVVAYTVAVFRAVSTNLQTISLNLQFLLGSELAHCNLLLSAVSPIILYLASVSIWAATPAMDPFLRLNEHTRTHCEAHMLQNTDPESSSAAHEFLIPRQCTDVRMDTDTVPALQTVNGQFCEADPRKDLVTELYGGGLATPQVFAWHELVRYLPEDGVNIPPLRFAMYELLKYTDISEADALLTNQRTASVSLGRSSFIAAEANERARTEILIEITWPVFTPSTVAQELISMMFRPEYMGQMVSGIKPFGLDDLAEFAEVPESLCEHYIYGAKFAGLHELGTDTLGGLLVDSAVFCFPVPWMRLAHKANKQAAIVLAKLHGIPLSSKASRSDAIEALGSHTCMGCKDFEAVFHPVSSESRRPQPPRQRSQIKGTRNPILPSNLESESDDDEDGANDSDVSIDESLEDTTAPRKFRIDPPYIEEHQFPPAPLSEHEKLHIIESFCDAMQPAAIEEAGCTVCGQLTPKTSLVPFQGITCSLVPLIEPGIMRLERSSPRERLDFGVGPVLDETCDSICHNCHSSLKRGKRPRKALANGLWLGAVPRQLQGLTYAEQCLIARVRSNRCVVRVAMGQARMMANAVSFACPTMKVYQNLPPTREELDDVLAFIFTGIRPPNEDDLERTPMLVRRNKVGTALEWLKANHADYQDLNIDYATLDGYPESGIPVEVIFRKTEQDTNVVAAATSVHEGNDEEGASEGACPLKVNGLIGENLESMSFDARKAAAVHHLQTGGHVLAVGHSQQAESMYDNPQLYPQMYPWLFPYGVGGIGNAHLRGLVSEKRQKQWLLLYHDKRFQRDSRFVLVAFSHEQIKTGARSSYVLMQRRNFESLAAKLSHANPEVIRNITNRLLEGEKVVPVTEDEKFCFSLMDQIEHVGVSVPGSMAGRKRMRANLWSMITNKGSPSWFVTLSPVDINHPICLYWADRDLTFRPRLRTKNERMRLIAQNPVAGARFFRLMVQLFIKHLLRWEDEAGRPGIFGHSDAHFGTVEQQGRMTLHLHMLVWVACSLSPAEVRKRLLSGNSEFQRDLIAYLESCQIGEFMTGTMLEMDDRHADRRPKGQRNRGNEIDPSDPTQRLPSAPPKVECARRESSCICNDCAAHREWMHRYTYRTSTSVGGRVLPRVKEPESTRETFEESTVDSKGRIQLKKLEPRINTVNDTMVYCFGCNTDSTCLMSGTAVNATVGYVADYIVKMGLKTHQIFSSIYDVFEKNTDIWEESRSRQDAARKMIMRMANSLSAKMEIGAPMAAMYLLGHGDNYCSHSFLPLYWKQFHSDVLSVWERGSGNGDDPFDDEETVEVPSETISVARSGTNIISKSSVEDYKLRPTELESVCVYDWIQCGTRVRMTSKSNRASCLRYQEGHPLRDTHGVSFDSHRSLAVIPSFMGPNLPRRDNEDEREYYCCVMLTLFAPWRSGLELKSSAESWAEAFDRYPFSRRHRTLILNTNLRFECFDARDDYHSQMCQRIAQLQAETDDVDAIPDEDLGESDDLPLPQSLLDDDALGDWSKRRKDQMSEAEAILQRAGWSADSSLGAMHASDTSFRPERFLIPSKWKSLMAKERERVLNNRRRGIPNCTHSTGGWH